MFTERKFRTWFLLSSALVVPACFAVACGDDQVAIDNPSSGDGGRDGSSADSTVGDAPNNAPDGANDATLDKTAPDTTAPDASTPDTNTPDAASDTSTPDATRDSSTLDASSDVVVDAAAADADAGTVIVVDAGPVVQFCKPQPSALVSYWTFDGTLGDARGTNTGAGVPAITYGNGHLAGAIDLGASAYVNVVDDVSLQPTAGVAIAAWIQPTTTGTRSIVDKFNTAKGYKLEYVGGAGGGQIHFQTDRFDLTTTAGADAGDAGAAISFDGVFRHVVATYDGTAAKIYVDGVERASQAATGALTHTPNTNLHIGANSAGATPFQGRIDDVELWNRGVTPAEVAELFTFSHCKYASCAAQPSGAIVWYTGDGETTDRLGATALAENTSNVLNYGAGKVGSAFALSGSGFLGGATGVGSILNTITSQVTLEAWVYPEATNQTARIVDHIGAGLSDGYLLDLQAGKPRLIVGTATTIAVNTIPINTWTHLVGTFDGTHVTLYVNGVKDANEVTLGSVAAVPVNSTRELRLGGDSGGNNRFTGRLDEVILYRRALTAGEVAAKAGATNGVCRQMGCAPSPASLSALYSGESNMNDSWGNANGSLAGDAGAMSYATGEVGSALSLATNRYVSLPAAATLNPTTVTIEGWVNPSAVANASIFDSFGSNTGFRFELEANGSELLFAMGAGSGTSNVFIGFSNEVSVPINRWSHVALTISAAGGISVFVNGTIHPFTAMTFTQNLAASVLLPRIGLSQAGTKPFNGLIDELAIYRRALTGSELREIYLAGPQGRCRSF